MMAFLRNTLYAIANVIAAPMNREAAAETVVIVAAGYAIGRLGGALLGAPKINPFSEEMSSIAKGDMGRL